MKKRHQLSVLIFISLFLGACQQTEQPSIQTAQNSAVENMRVTTVQPIVSLVKTEPFPLPNCGGTGEIHQTLGSTASITKGITVSGKATVNGGVEEQIPATVKLKLEIEIEAAYQKVYDSANSRLDTIDMPAAAKTHVIYDIGWYEQAFSSIVQYSSDGQIYEVPYTYKLQVPKIDNSHQIPCATSTTSPASGNNINTPEPTTSVETATPQPTPTKEEFITPTLVLEIGEWWNEDGVGILLQEVIIKTHGIIEINLDISNDTGHDLIFSWSASKNFVLTDNTGYRYQHTTNDSGANVNLGSGVTDDLDTQGYSRTSLWEGERVFDDSVTDLYFTVQNLAGTSSITWHIPVK